MLRHALRSALVPIVTVSGLAVGYLITGAVIVEYTFGLNGLGYGLITAIQDKDFAVVQAIALIFTGVFVVANLVADVLYVIIDPLSPSRTARRRIVSVAYEGSRAAAFRPHRHRVAAKVAAAYIVDRRAGRDPRPADRAARPERHRPDRELRGRKLGPPARTGRRRPGHLLAPAVGARLSLLGPFAVVSLSLIVGIPARTLAGWRGGVVDALLSRIADALFAFPPLLLAIVIAATFGAGFRTSIIAIIGHLHPAPDARRTRPHARRAEKTYVDACACQGFGVARITWLHVSRTSRRHRRPGHAQLRLRLIDLAALAFLGLGVQPPTADWGAMLSRGGSRS